MNNSCSHYIRKFQVLCLRIVSERVLNLTKAYRPILRVKHIKCYRAIALKLLIISKNVSDKSFSVREGRHTRPPYFFIGGGAEAMSRSTPLFK